MKQYDNRVVKEKELLRMQDEQAQRSHEIARENQQQHEIESNRNFELDKIRTNAYREIAIEYAKNQPKTIYNNINWR